MLGLAGLCQFLENSRSERQTPVHWERHNRLLGEAHPSIRRGRLAHRDRITASPRGWFSQKDSRTKIGQEKILACLLSHPCQFNYVCTCERNINQIDGLIWPTVIYIFLIFVNCKLSFFILISFYWDCVFCPSSGRVNYNNWEQFLLILSVSIILLVEMEDIHEPSS